MPQDSGLKKLQNVTAARGCLRRLEVKCIPGIRVTGKRIMKRTGY